MPNIRVFTYGSLIFEDIFLKVAGQRFDNQPATLSGWSRHRLQARTYPGAVRASESKTQIDGVLWTNLSNEALSRLDKFEGLQYRRESVVVSINATTWLNAWIYRWIDLTALADAWDIQTFAAHHKARFADQHMTAAGLATQCERKQ